MEPCRNFISRPSWKNIILPVLFEHKSRHFKALSDAVLSRDTFSFRFNSSFFGETCIKWLKIFRTHAKNTISTSEIFYKISIVDSLQIFNKKLMRAVIRVFVTLKTKSIWEVWPLKNFQEEKLFIDVQRSSFQNLRSLGWEICELYNNFFWVHFPLKLFFGTRPVTLFKVIFFCFILFSRKAYFFIGK